MINRIIFDAAHVAMLYKNHLKSQQAQRFSATTEMINWLFGEMRGTKVAKKTNCFCYVFPFYGSISIDIRQLLWSWLRRP